MKNQKLKVSFYKPIQALNHFCWLYFGASQNTKYKKRKTVAWLISNRKEVEAKRKFKYERCIKMARGLIMINRALAGMDLASEQQPLINVCTLVNRRRNDETLPGSHVNGPSTRSR